MATWQWKRKQLGSLWPDKWNLKLHLSPASEIIREIRCQSCVIVRHIVVSIRANYDSFIRLSSNVGARVGLSSISGIKKKMTEAYMQQQQQHQQPEASFEVAGLIEKFLTDSFRSRWKDVPSARRNQSGTFLLSSCLLFPLLPLVLLVACLCSQQQKANNTSVLHFPLVATERAEAVALIQMMMMADGWSY